MQLLSFHSEQISHIGVFLLLLLLQNLPFCDDYINDDYFQQVRREEGADGKFYSKIDRVEWEELL